MQKFKVIGLMSGTSLDGLDIAYCSIWKKESTWKFELHHCKTYSYNRAWQEKLSTAFCISQKKLEELDIAYGKFLGEKVLEFTHKYNIPKNEINFIASHGHTVFHNPEQGITKQIGCGKTLATTTNTEVIYDFRSLDVKRGGQGAPLVPIGDAYFFKNYDACINLGGFSNISFKKEKTIQAFDICPVNIVLNHYAMMLDIPYDPEGENAKKGQVIHSLLKKLNALPYYQKIPPKSLGREWVEATIFPLTETYLSSYGIEDIMRTFIEHIADQFTAVIQQNALEKILLSGGGCFNTFMINRLNKKLKTTLIIPDENLISFKEALIFGLLGVLHHLSLPNCLASVTGATKDSIGGVLAKPMGD